MCGDKFVGDCAKCMLWIVNALVWVAGAALLGIGIWVAVSPQTFINQSLVVIGLATQNDNYALELSQYLFSNNQLMLIGAYIMIGAGGFLFLVGFCGCCGAQRGSKCLLVIYCIFCAVSLLVTLAAGIVEVVYQNQMNSLITSGFVSLQQTQFDALYNSTQPLSELWYLIMQGSKCCGVYGQGDFQVNVTSMAPKWYANNRYTCAKNWCTSNAMLPASCCQQYPNGTLVDTTCVTAGTTTYSFLSSCQSTAIAQIQATLQQYSTVVMGVTFGLSGVCLLAIVAGAILIHDIGKSA